MVKSIDFLKVLLLVLIPVLFFMHALFQLTPKTSITNNIKTVIYNSSSSNQSREAGK